MSNYKIIWEKYTQPMDAVRPYQQLTSLSSLLAQATETGPMLQPCGDHLASRMNGKFILAENKTEISAATNVDGRLKGITFKPRERFDYCRGVVLVDNIDDIRKARSELTQITDHNFGIIPGGEIAHVRDLYAFPSKAGFRGIFLAVKTPNQHLSEIQIHIAEYWNKIIPAHALFKAARKINYGFAGKEMPQHIQKQQAELIERREHLLEEAAEQTNADSLHVFNRNEQDCSWPVRTQLNRFGDLEWLIATPSIAP